MSRCLVLLVAVVVACSPTFDWREVRPAGSRAVVLFPCKPSSESRMVELAGTRVEMTVSACSAGKALWAMGHADVGDPSRVTPALAELSAAATRNVGGDAAVARPFKIDGMTPNAHAQRLSIAGRQQDGRPVVSQAALFARGTRVYQMIVVGTAPDEQAIETFFAALRLPS